MNKKRVLITGGSGLLALNWACAIRERWDVILGTHLHSVKLRGTSQYSLELDDISKLEFQVEQLSPDLIVHTAGMTSVDQCENNPMLAKQVNAKIAKNVAIVSERHKIKFIHISTDHLFLGDKKFYTENSNAEPLNEYARSKLLAEKWVQEVNPDALILRTNFFGWGNSHRQSFSDWIIYSLRNNQTINMFDDVFITPIIADSLAIFAHKLINQGASGIYNLVGDERVSKFEFALKLAKIFGLPVKNIKRSYISNADLLAKRPSDMSLNNQMTSKKLGISLGRLEDYFLELQKQEIDGRRTELYNSMI